MSKITENSGFSASLLDALDLPGKLKKEDEKWVIVFDEFQEINRLDGELIEKQFRSIVQFHQDIGYAFLGSKTHMMLNMFVDKRRAFYNIGKIQKLNKIPEQEMIDHLEKEYNKGGFVVEEGIFEKAFSYTENIPYYNQYLAYQIWQVAGEEDKIIDEKVVEKAVNLILDNQGDYYYSLLNQLTGYEHSVLQDFLQFHKKGIKTAFNFGTVAERLIELGIIEQMEDKYIFGDPFLPLYLRLRTSDRIDADKI